MFPFPEKPGKKKENYIQEQLQIEEYLEEIPKKEEKEKNSDRGVVIIDIF